MLEQYKVINDHFNRLIYKNSVKAKKKEKEQVFWPTPTEFIILSVIFLFYLENCSIKSNL